MISLGAGVAVTDDLGANNNFPVINPNTDEFYYYQAQHSSTTAGLFDAFIGGEWALCDNWLLQTGLGYDIATSYRVNSTLTQGADVQSQNVYAYHYQLMNQQLMAEAKLLYKFMDRYHPYAMLGLGASFNSVYNFSTNVPPFLSFTRDFKNYLNTSFTYSFSVGVDMDVTQNVRVGLGYRFADLGNAASGGSSINSTYVSGSLSQSHMYVNQVLAQITYLG